MPSVLVVDDERQIVEIARDYLQHAGFSVTTARNGPEALERARSARPDLIVLDLGLPGLDGLEVTKALRRDTTIPIIFLTARVEESVRIRGLEAGADDYVTKPFSPRELVARVKAVLRRSSSRGETPDTLRLGDLHLDLAKQRAVRGRTPIELTATEFQILATLARHPGRIFTRAQLLDAVRGTEVESFDRAIDTHIKNIWRKVEKDPRDPRSVLTVYGVGYKGGES